MIAHSYYSFRYGTLAPEQLAEAAAKFGYKTLLLTDINNTSCSYAFIESCKKWGVRPILGIEFREAHAYRYTGIAKNKEGFRELNAFLTKHSMEGKALPRNAPQLKNAYFIYTHLVKPIEEFHDNEFLGVRPEHVNRLFTSPLKAHQDKLVIFNPITFLDDDWYKVHKLLRAIDLNTLITKLTKKNHATENERLMNVKELLKYYQQYPAIIENTAQLFSNCSIEMEVGNQVNRQNFTGSKDGDLCLLKKLALNGCKRRYGKQNIEALERVNRELDVIERLDFSSYFLITWDIIRYAQSAGYHHVGRGSGANSIVAYCVYITDVDPMELDLYFERFINPYRSSPPDFDIDFSWDERDDVTDYIFKRYGYEHTALLATYSTFKGKSIIRELGKVFGLPKEDIDKIVKRPLETEQHHPLAKHIFKFGKMIEGFPNYLSIHAGGVLISEEPINYHTALQMMPKGFPITHFDMYGAEDLKYHKFDILSQRGLGHIKDSVDLINRNKGEVVNVHQIANIKQDKRVKDLLRSGRCIGCFYIESPAMRGLLSKLQCDNYVHLVAASSIIRPGVAKSGMMREYIKRFHDPESFEYIHPVFEEHLSETFGVMVYQEDVMKICHHFSGLDLDESDVLRRIMTGKRKSSDAFHQLKEKYFINCKERGHSDEMAQEVWRQIESFSGYSFCKAHSASFAVESFQSMYLKAYHPLEFMVAVINNFGGFYRTELYVHEARMLGGNINAPCVNNSQYLTSIQGKDIYIGYVHIHQMERKISHRIVLERAKNGVFKNLENFVSRMDIGTEQLEILIRIGAFRFTGMTKCELMWEKNAVFNPSAKVDRQALTMFSDGTERFALPTLEESKYDQAFDEFELLGFSLSSPFDLIDRKLDGNILGNNLKQLLGKRIEIIGYYIERKHVTTSNRKLMAFGTWIDREGHFFDTVHFPPSFARFPFKGIGCYRIQGKVVEDFEFPSIEVDFMERLPYVKDERY